MSAEPKPTLKEQIKELLEIIKEDRIAACLKVTIEGMVKVHEQSVNACSIPHIRIACLKLTIEGMVKVHEQSVNACSIPYIRIACLKVTIEGMVKVHEQSVNACSKKGDEMPPHELPGQVTDLFKDLMTIPAALDAFHLYYKQYGISEERTIKISFFHLPLVIRHMIKAATEEEQKDAEVSWNKWKMFVLEQLQNVVGSDRILQLIDEVRIEQGDYLAEKHSMLVNLCWLQSAEDIRREGWAHRNRKLPPYTRVDDSDLASLSWGARLTKAQKKFLDAMGKPRETATFAGYPEENQRWRRTEYSARRRETEGVRTRREKREREEEATMRRTKPRIVKRKAVTTASQKHLKRQERYDVGPFKFR
eukprot:PhF_6_TR26052/c1_g1_i7/m.36693